MNLQLLKHLSGQMLALKSAISNKTLPIDLRTNYLSENFLMALIGSGTYPSLQLLTSHKSNPSFNATRFAQHRTTKPKQANTFCGHLKGGGNTTTGTGEKPKKRALAPGNPSRGLQLQYGRGHGANTQTHRSE